MATKIINFEFNPEVFNDVYMHTYSKISRYLIYFGSAGSGKSVFACQKILLRMLQEEDHRFLFLRKVAKTIRNSQFQLTKDIISKWNVAKYFDINKTDMAITCNLNGNQILTAGLDDPEKIKSIQGITGIWIEEATELTLEDLTQVDLRLRGYTKNYKQIMLSYNPINIFHWLNDRFHKKKTMIPIYSKQLTKIISFLMSNISEFLRGLLNKMKTYIEFMPLENGVY